MLAKVRVLTAMCAAAVTLSASAGLAHASAPEPAPPSNQLCYLTLPTGTRLAYLEGESISITLAGGQKLTYTCKGGTWVQTYTFGGGRSPITISSGTLLARP